MSDWLSEAQGVAAQVARTVHKKYHTYFDVADVRQELVVWILRREDKVKEWLDPTLETEERKVGVKMLGKALSRQADKYCRKRKAQQLGYALEDEHYYPPVDLHVLLPFVWRDAVSSKNPNTEKVSGSGNPAEGGNYIIHLFDIRKGLEHLDPQDRMVLYMRYYENMFYPDIAERLEISETTARRKVDGALRRLSNYLGGISPFKKEEKVVDEGA